MTLPALPTAEFDNADQIYAGDTFQWIKTLVDYPASDGWTLKYSLRGVNAAFIYDFQATQDPDLVDYDVTIPATDSSIWVPGDAVWQSWIVLADTGETHTVDHGLVAILAPLVSEAQQPPSTWKQIRENLEQVALQLSTKGYSSISAVAAPGRKKASPN